MDINGRCSKIFQEWLITRVSEGKFAMDSLNTLRPVAHHRRAAIHASESMHHCRAHVKPLDLSRQFFEPWEDKKKDQIDSLLSNNKKTPQTHHI